MYKVEDYIFCFYIVENKVTLILCEKYILLGISALVASSDPELTSLIPMWLGISDQEYGQKQL